MCKTGGFLFPVKVTRFVSKSFFTPCGVCAFFQLSAKTICGAPRSTPRLLSFHEESNQRRAKEEVSSLDSPLRGTSPRELREAKFSPPVCSASRRMSGIATATSDSRVPSSSAASAVTVGFQKGLAPLAGGQGTRRFLARLSSISSR